MALVACSECGQKVSTDAKACPGCGAKPPKRTSTLTKLLALILIPGVLYGVISSGGTESSTAAPKPPVDPAVAARDAQRGVAAVAVKSLRKAMHDPESFQLEEALFMADGAGCYTYRAKNGFGAMRRYQALMTPKAQLYSSDQGAAFIDLWNKWCGGKSGEPITAYVNSFVL